MDKEPLSFDLHPRFLHEFMDEDGHLDQEELEMFLNSLNEEQLRIIKDKANDPEALLSLKIGVQSDLDNTAKALAMES